MIDRSYKVHVLTSQMFTSPLLREMTQVILGLKASQIEVLFDNKLAL